MEIWGHCKYLKCSSDFKLFDGRTLRFIRTHPEELNLSESHKSKYGFWTFSEKDVGDHEIIKLTTHFCFGESYDHYKHSGNIMRHYYGVQKFILKIKIWSFEKKIFEIPKFHQFFQSSYIIQTSSSMVERCFLTSEGWVLTLKNSSL